ncbi:hypothetical protein CJ232_01100 [Hoylesella timonensis]|uniref:Uncharacterized protein n=1 Tax=Hoylesella timonensis TaxID=386414 RepID=A0A2N6Q8Q4_9BACT|nr:hypothetical protein CJ232_01100 [Hoylesella timonensis]
MGRVDVHFFIIDVISRKKKLVKLNGIHDFEENNINIFLLFIWFLKIELIYLQRFFQKKL